ncbi:MAG TPA: methyltransferase domain-containing protein [Stellaceae bacterium]|nr:methyltransferase domain-containing protein [Stellaceae bacterium]
MQPSGRHAESAPSPWVGRYAGLIRPGGRALDLAAGAGRHTSLLLARGLTVVAVDRDTADLRAAFGAYPACRVVELDLEDGGPWRLGRDYDGIVVTNYLHRPLLPALAEALGPGGVLIYETFMRGQEAFGKPSNPDFLLAPGELRLAYAGTLEVIAFEEGVFQEPRPAALQRIAARKGL